MLAMRGQFYMDYFYFYSQQHNEVGTVILLMLQMRKLRTEYKSRAKLTRGGQAPKPLLVTTTPSA